MPEIKKICRSCEDQIDENGDFYEISSYHDGKISAKVRLCSLDCVNRWHIKHKMNPHKEHDIEEEIHEASIAKRNEFEKAKFQSEDQQKIEEIKPQIYKANNRFFDYPNQSKKDPTSSKNIYAFFINYGTKGLEVRLKKGIKGRVRYTVRKYANTSLFIKSNLNPGWDFAPASALDLDTKSSEITPNATIDPKNAKYQVGYKYFKNKN